MGKSETNLEIWLTALNSNAVNVWREAMTQLRRLSDDVWNGLRFFLTVNGILVGAAMALFKLQGLEQDSAVGLAVLSTSGLLITWVGRFILAKQRRYYLEMLLRKTLIEKELGFYDRILSDTDMAFPWRVMADDLPALMNSPSIWIDNQMRRKGTITHRLFLIYEGLMWFYLIAILIFIYGMARGWS